jgi:DNA-binding response OmpR family regulator
MKKRILVVDEDQLILYALAKALKDEEIEVVTAATTSTAIEKLSSCKYDLCLLDLRLTDLSALGLMKIIRDNCPATKIILMTADNIAPPDLSEIYIHAITNGACHIIRKPFNLSEVAEAVQQVLAGVENLSIALAFNDADCEKKSRKHPRKPWNEKIYFQTSIIHQGISTRLSVEADTVDISDSGIGFLTQYPLKESQVISFDEKLDNKLGVVAWSKMIDDKNCRVGAKFS